MDRTPVRSSNVASIGYEERAQTLEVEFEGGAVYQYTGVPESVHAALMHSPSIGGFLNANIKPRYRYRKVR